MSRRNEGKHSNSGVPSQPKADTPKEDGHVLPAEKIGNVTSGLDETPDRPEPANGDCPPEEKADHRKS